MGIMCGFGQAGWINNGSMFVAKENLVLFIIAAVGATPFLKKIGMRMEASRSGYGIAVYRVLEKLVPAILLIVSIAYIVDATYNPFLYFRF